jgi:hypothetical protein
MKNLRALYVSSTSVFTDIAARQRRAQASLLKSNTSLITAIGLLPKQDSSVRAFFSFHSSIKSFNGNDAGIFFVPSNRASVPGKEGKYSK